MTSPCDTFGCYDGKRDWLKRHYPGFENRIVATKQKHMLAARNKILIDDHEMNCEMFRCCGGYAITPARPWNNTEVGKVNGWQFDAEHVVNDLIACINEITGSPADK
jgi:5'(3')-deoxyribonucleotidase